MTWNHLPPRLARGTTIPQDTIPKGETLVENQVSSVAVAYVTAPCHVPYPAWQVNIPNLSWHAPDTLGTGSLLPSFSKGMFLAGSLDALL